MKSTLEVLREARALIDTPEKWTKEADARDADGEELIGVLPSSDAVCWCAGGAIAQVIGRVDVLGTSAFHVLAAVMGVQAPYEFNDRDETTHADVLAAFDKAIAAEEAKA